MNILFLNVGRRCELVREFKRVLPKFFGGGLVFGSDINPLAPALSKVDESVIFPHSSSTKFKKVFIKFCRLKNIGLVIPTIDPDLKYLSANLEEFKRELPNTLILASSSEIVKLTEDKRLTKRFFAENGAIVPNAVEVRPDMNFPVFVKPACGSAGEGARKINDYNSLSVHLDSIKEPVVEELINGPEYTVDVFCDQHGRARLAIPRKRLAVRGGEVSRGVVERDSELEALSCRLAESLGVKHPITIQFRKSVKGFVAMEINARIGGGLPLTMAAGGDWPLWILQMAHGFEARVADNVRDAVLFSRHDESVILNPTEKAEEIPDLSKVKLIIFDMDDTLYPERDFVFSGYKEASRYVYKEYGLFIEDELRRRFDEGQRGDLFSVVLNSLGVTLYENEIKQIVNVYRTHKPVISPYVDVAVIGKLKALGFKIGLITDGWCEVQKRKWDSLGMDKEFDYKIFTDEFGREFWKPHSRSFIHICKLAGVKPEEAVYVGDNPIKDFVAPNKLGMKSLRIRRHGGENSMQEVSQSGQNANFEIRSLNELSELLQADFSTRLVEGLS